MNKAALYSVFIVSCSRHSVHCTAGNLAPNGSGSAGLHVLADSTGDVQHGGAKHIHSGTDSQPW
jgi:hypothetical protein